MTSDVVFDCAFSPQGDRLATAAADGVDPRLRRGQRQRAARRSPATATGSSPSPGTPTARKLATASRDKTAKVFDAKTGELLITYNGHNQPVRGVLFHPDGKEVYSAGSDNKLHRWSIAEAARKRRTPASAAKPTSSRPPANRSSPPPPTTRSASSTQPIKSRSASSPARRTGSSPPPITRRANASPAARSTARSLSGTPAGRRRSSPRSMPLPGLCAPTKIVPGRKLPSSCSRSDRCYARRDVRLPRHHARSLRKSPSRRRVHQESVDRHAARGHHPRHRPGRPGRRHRGRSVARLRGDPALPADHGHRATAAGWSAASSAACRSWRWKAASTSTKATRSSRSRCRSA